MNKVNKLQGDTVQQTEYIQYFIIMLSIIYKSIESGLYTSNYYNIVNQLYFNQSIDQLIT